MSIEVGDVLERTKDSALFKVVDVVRFHVTDPAYGPSGIGYEYILESKDQREEVKLDSLDHLQNDWFRVVDPDDVRRW